MDPCRDAEKKGSSMTALGMENLGLLYFFGGLDWMLVNLYLLSSG